MILENGTREVNSKLKNSWFYRKRLTLILDLLKAKKN